MGGGATHTRWLDCFPKVTNGEMRALYRVGFANAVQMEIVLYIITQTRGVGRIMAGELDGAGHDEWEAVFATYGREAAPLYQGGIAAAIQRHRVHVGRELRKLIAAGIVVEHEAGRKSKAAVLSVDLDPQHWRPTALHPETSQFHKAAVKRDVNEKCGNQSVSLNGSQSVPESATCGSGSAALFKRRKSETEDPSSCEEETLDPRHAKERGSGERDSDPAACITTPALRELAERLMQRGDCEGV